MLQEIIIILKEERQKEAVYRMKKAWGAKGDLVHLYLLEEQAGSEGEYPVAGCLREVYGRSAAPEKEAGEQAVPESSQGYRKERSEPEAPGSEISGQETVREIPDAYRRETVFVTDTGAVLAWLLKKGCYVIALLHEGNEAEDLSAASYAMTSIGEMEYVSFCQAYERMAGLPWTIQETARCTIRETTVEDVDRFYEIYSDPEMTRYTEGLFPDPEEERAYIRNYIREVYGFLGYGMWTIVCRASGEIIGRAGLSWREGAEMPELGFLIGCAWQRQGYAYEVCRAILEYAQRELEFFSIQALVKKENRASVKLCEKLGFRHAGEVSVGEEIYEFYVTELEEDGS